MNVIVVDEGGGSHRYTKHGRDAFRELHDIADQHLQLTPGAKVTTDMDGVLVHDDLAIVASEILMGQRGVDYFDNVANLNIEAVSKGQTAYCWYAPTLFLGGALVDLPVQFNTVLGENLRLVFRSRQHVTHLRELGYDVTAVTAGIQEAAEAVSQRVGIENTVGTIISSEGGVYTGEVGRFIGGRHKLETIEKILMNGQWEGTHVGDSWSDIESMRGHPRSIAFNPNNPLAVASAKVNVFGYDKTSLTPLFDPTGSYDESGTQTLPDAVVVYQNTPSQEGQHISEELRTELVALGKRMKSKVGLLAQFQLPKRKLYESIKGILGDMEMTQEFISSRLEGLADELFMPLQRFDAYAKRAYEALGQ